MASGRCGLIVINSSTSKTVSGTPHQKAWRPLALRQMEKIAMRKMAMAKGATAVDPMRHSAMDLMNLMEQMTVTITMKVIMEVKEVTGLEEALAALSPSPMRRSQNLQVQQSLVPCQFKMGKLLRMRHL